MAPDHDDEKTIPRASRHLVVIQATPFCNIDCKYCYLPTRSSTARIERETLKTILAQVFAHPHFAEPVHILWHAGEPLTVPVGFYRDAFALASELAASLDRTFVFSLQTNATLIDDEWIRFFRDCKVRVGVSIDGPDFIHDRNRVTRAGKGTHARAMRGIVRLQEAGVPFQAIAVLTRFSLDYPDEMFRFFVDHVIKEVGFNIDELEAAHQTSSFGESALSGLPDGVAAYRAFIRRFLELIFAHPGSLAVRELQRMSGRLIGGTGHIHNSTAIPMDIITFDYKGNYTTFCPELSASRSERFGDFVMGNVAERPIADLWSSTVFQDVYAEIRSGLERCKATCPYWSVCGGGNQSNKFSEHGRFDVTETIYCRINVKALADETLAFLEAQAATA